MLKLMNSCRKVINIRRNISLTSFLQNDEIVKKPKRKVSETVELVTLVDENDKILGLKPKPETEKLARKLNLSLQRVTDTKYGKMYPAYKLMSAAQMLALEKKKSNAKTLKKIPINPRITDNDLKIKLSIIKKWISKNFEVHVAISGNTGALAKAVFQKMEEDLKEESRIIDVRHKEDSLKFIALPPKKNTNVPKKSEQKEKVNDQEEVNDIT